MEVAGRQLEGLVVPGYERSLVDVGPTHEVRAYHGLIGTRAADESASVDAAPPPDQPAPPGAGVLAAEAIDDLARWAIERARPIHVGLATTPEDLEQVHRLRHRAVVEAGWAEAGPSADGLERDEDDDRALHVAAWNGPDVVGTIRVVLPSRGRPLPTEVAFDLIAEPAGQVVDWGRLVVDPAHRDPEHVVMLALLGRAWLATREHGAVACLGVATPEILDLYRSIGVQATVLAGPRLHWGEQRFAALLSGVSTDAAERMGREDSEDNTPGPPPAEASGP